ncbi:hypothetical protein MT418_002345 [Batrachochytrium dendrobatidis]
MAIPATPTNDHPLILVLPNIDHHTNQSQYQHQLVETSTTMASVSSAARAALTQSNGSKTSFQSPPHSISAFSIKLDHQGKSPLSTPSTLPQTLQSSNASTPERPVLVHYVTTSDTLAGICVMYGVKAADIKRHNRMWTNDSIHLRRYLEIPISLSESCHQQDGRSPKSAASASSSLSYRPPSLDDSYIDLYSRRPGSISADFRPATLTTSNYRSDSSGRTHSVSSSTSGSLHPNLHTHHPPTASELLSQIDMDVKQILGNLEDTFVNGVVLPICNEKGTMYPPPAPHASHSLSRLKSNAHGGSVYPYSAMSVSPISSPSLYMQACSSSSFPMSMSPTSSHSSNPPLRPTSMDEMRHGTGCMSAHSNFGSQSIMTDPLWSASSSTTRVKIMPMSTQAGAAHSLASAPLRVLFEWTPLFGHVLSPDMQQSVEDNLRGELRKKLADVDRELVLEQASRGIPFLKSSRSSRDCENEWVGLREMKSGVVG